MGENHRYPRWHGVSRDEILWWPLVQSCKCDGCGLCVISCPAEALAFDYTLRIPFISAVHRCDVGCSVCATLCPNEAILLPDRETLQAIIEQHHLDIVASQELRRRGKRFARVLPQAIYPGDVAESHN